jgi:hypothetical protein
MGLSLRFLVHSGSPRALPSRRQHTLSLRGGNASDRRGNPSCLGGRRRLGSSLTEGQWIATGFSPREDNTRVRKRSEVSYPTPFQSSIFTLQSSLLKSRRSVRLASGSASGQDFPRFFITGFFGNLHGSLGYCCGYRGCGCCA